MTENVNNVLSIGYTMSCLVAGPQPQIPNCVRERLDNVTKSTRTSNSNKQDHIGYGNSSTTTPEPLDPIKRLKKDIYYGC